MQAAPLNGGHGMPVHMVRYHKNLRLLPGRAADDLRDILRRIHAILNTVNLFFINFLRSFSGFTVYKCNSGIEAIVKDRRIGITVNR